MRRLMLCLLTLSLVSCVGTGDGGYQPVVALPRINLKPAPSSKPMVPSTLLIEGVSYEQHGVTDPNKCESMLQRFLKEGRKVTLVKVVRNNFNKSGGALEYICLFGGEDAEPEGGTFEDPRYNSPDEYVYP